MSRFVAWIQALTLSLGAPGLLLVTALDSSILSLPEIADILVVWMVTQHKGRVVLYATSATIGSIAGCLLLYYIGRKGGEALVRSRFGASAFDKAFAVSRRYGVMAVLVASILPPPAPFKIFVLLAGAANVGVGRFSFAIAIGRGARYFLEGFLAVWYGDRALSFMRENATTVSLGLASVLVAGVLGYVVWTKARTAKHR